MEYGTTFSLRGSRDSWTIEAGRREIADAVERALALFQTSDVRTVEAATKSLEAVQAVLEEVRTLPRGPERTVAMNTFVRTLGRRQNLAMYLERLELVVAGVSDGRPAYGDASLGDRLHCLYGWAGQTLLLASKADKTAGTEPPAEDLGGFLGYCPAEWFLSIHIWQPNPEARGFASPRSLGRHAVAEPPHSHPYDFVSYVAAGELFQSLYSRTQIGESGEEYERVDGVWPPHALRESSRLSVVEERVSFAEGASYAMDRDAIHDVEVDSRTAASTPAVTLFLASEAVVKPDAFISTEMAEFHEQTPDLRDAGEALPLDRWQEKLRLTAAYLAGRSQTLDLRDVVQCGQHTGFLNFG